MANDIVLITGASSGIGEALARRVAETGRAVGLVARRADRLDALAAELRGDHGVDAHVFACDLIAPGAVAALAAQVEQRGLTVDWLVNNAGFGTFGAFHTLPVERELEEIRLNVEALVEATGRFLPGMVRRRRGVVMNVASIGGLFPGPFMSTYTATKAFVVAFSAGLEVELRGTGVSVLCVCPGFTRTEFQSHVDVDTSQIPSLAWQSADDVAVEALAAAERGGILVNGRMNRVFTGFLGFLPRTWVTRASAALLRPRAAAD
ncbi:MAG TPA: SDR family oxidoreductase [Candidatus Limnocylindria bacterium]|nr:SDR family oxidoreductase [Candidatus Limnocylindria bacterium]